MDFDAAAILQWWERALWPFLRIGAVATAAPVIGARFVPARVRLLFAAAITLVLLPVLPEPARLELFAARWWLAIAEQVAIGVAIGFALQLVFEAVMFAGELIAHGIGLSFAQMNDPLRGSDSPVMSQFFLVLSMLLFLSLDGHQVLIAALADSFRTLPVGVAPDAGVALALAQFGAQIFAGGLAIALPAVMALMIVNLSFGVISRAAPTLNLFAVGFPLTLVFGLAVLQFALPSLQVVLAGLLESAWVLISQMMRPAHG